MDPKVIADKQLVERYLLGRLPPPEARFFEQMVRKSPELAEQLGLIESLRRTMRLLDDTGTEWRESAPKFWHAPWVPAALAGVAGLMMVIGLSLWSAKHRLEQRHAQLQVEAARGLLLAPASSTPLRLLPARPGEAPPTYPIGSRATPTLAELRVDVGYATGNLYRITLKRDDGTFWARLDNQLRDSNGELRLGFNSGAFVGGSYDVTIESVNLRGDGTLAGRLRLRVD